MNPARKSTWTVSCPVCLQDDECTSALTGRPLLTGHTRRIMLQIERDVARSTEAATREAFTSRNALRIAP